MSITSYNSSDHSVVIIGAGIIGICCAWHLHKQGYSVTIIDSAKPGTKTSFGNAGCISPSHVVPFSHPGIINELPKWLFKRNSPLIIRWRQAITMFPWLKQFLQSGSRFQLPQTIAAISHLMASVNADWDAIIQETSSQRFIEKQGVIKLFENTKRLQAHQWALDISRERGYDYEEIQGLKLQSLEPDLKVTDSMRAAYFATWQHSIDPKGITEHIAQELRSRGVRFIQSKVNHIEVKPNARIAAHTFLGDTINAQHCVIACGVWSNELAARLDYSVPLLPKRGYHVMLHDSNININHPLLPMDDYFLITPMQGGLRFAGMAEFDLLDAVPDYRRADLLLKRSQKYFPNVEYRRLTQWMGQRPMLPDSLPIISQSPSHNNIFYAFGHGHYGLTQAPSTGRLIAQLVSKQVSQSDIRPYRFERFQ